jgi:tetratricopeptide (TPR) repeat protein
MIELTVLPATTPAISRAELLSLLERNVDDALARARTDLSSDPLAPVFDATWLNATGYSYVQRGQRAQGLAALRLATEAHPASANAFDSLSEVLEATGQRAEALATAEKALALLPSDRTVPADQRAALEAGLTARIRRLR